MFHSQQPRSWPRHAHCVTLVLFVCSLLSLSGATTPDAPIVTTSYGPLQGVVVGGCAQFLGIPYGVGVSGSQRWTNASAPRPWSPQVRMANQYGDICPQGISFPPVPADAPQAEECLNLNVYTPWLALPNVSAATTSADSALSAPLLPVMVYIHGGQFLAGTGRNPLFRGDELTRASTPVVVVTINYRLGALGWLGGTQLQGNFGFLDQQLALRWVQQEIASFGGDPGRVTIAGQSAGACSVGMHMVASSSANLFHRAVMFSNPLTLMHTVEVAQHYASTFYRLLDCADNDLDCLRQKPLKELVKGSIDVVEGTQFPLSSQAAMWWSPILDGVLFPLDQPLSLLRSGRAAQVPLLMGNCANEAFRFIPAKLDIPPALYKLILKELFPGNNTELREAYPCSSSDHNNNSLDNRVDCRPALATMMTDYLFLCPARTIAFGLSSLSGTPPVFNYQLVHPPDHDPINENNTACHGQVCHSADLPFWFNSQQYTVNSFGPGEQTLSDQMLDSFARFISGALETFAPGQLWVPFSPVTDPSVNFNVTPSPSSLVTHYRAVQCDMWDKIGYGD